MNRRLTEALAGTLVLCLAWSPAFAAEDAPDPLLAKPLAELKKMVESSDSEIDRILAADAIGKLLRPPAPPKKGAAPVAVRTLTAAERKLALEAAAVGIGDSSCAVRHYSRKALTILGETAVPVLGAALNHASINKKQAAALAIYDMGRFGKKDTSLPVGIEAVVPALTKALQHESYVVREAAAFACRGLGPVAAPALPQLIQRLEDAEFSVANAAVHAVAATDPSGEQSVPALVAALDSKHDLREFICVELAAMGQNAVAAVPALVKLVDADRNNWHAGNAACQALMAIVAFNPRDSEGNQVEDKAAKFRPLAIAAIVNSSLNHESHFCRWDRHKSLFLKPNLYCPFGDEIKPLIPKVVADLREYMPMKQTKFWPPRQETCDLAVRIGLSDDKQKQKIIALVKELLKDETTNEDGIKQLEKMLNTLEG